MVTTTPQEQPEDTLAPHYAEGKRLFDLQAQYIADLNPLPNLHHAAVLRSPHAHARIVRIDTSTALAMPGVVNILTGHDVEQWCRAFAVAAEKPGRYYPCAIDKVRYVGEPVAVVVATDRYVAEDACDQVAVEYEPLPAVVEVEAAMASSTPLLHDELGTNVAIDRHLDYGDVDSAFAAAEVVLSQRYVFPRYQSFPLETYGIVANWNPSASQATIWSNFHGPYSMLSVLAGALRIPVSKLRVITPPDVGGSFGNKITIYAYMALMALASRKAGVSVKWIEDRLESLSASSCGTDRVTYIEVAATGQGELLGLKMRLIDNVGAYIRAPEPGCLFRPIGNYVNAYRVKHLRVEALAVMTNTCPSGPNRGYGCQQHYFPIERMMDELALKLGTDPADLRLLNLIQPEALPYRTPTGGLYDSGDYPATLHKALARSDYWNRRRSSGAAVPPDATSWRGVGIAIAIDPSGSNMGYIDVSKRASERRPNMFKVGSAQTTRLYLDATGGVTVELDTAAHGQGHETTTAAIVAEELGLVPSNITVVSGMDTGSSPWTVSSGSYSSRFGAVGASSVVAAVQQLQHNLIQAAAYFLAIPRDRLVLQHGCVICTDDATQALSLRDIAYRLHWSAGTLPPALETARSVEATFVASDLDYPNERDQVNSSAVYAFTADVAVVDIDKETLDIRVKQYVTVHDAGNILHPKVVRGQLAGGVLHGIAGALYEELRYTETGDFLTGTLMDYLCPTVNEIPEEIVMDHIIIPTPKSLTGAKGLGESTAQTAPIAVANAVADALRHVGVEITELPITPSKLWEKIAAVSSNCPWPTFPARDTFLGRIYRPIQGNLAMSAFSKTALYAERTDLPPLVEQAVALANDLGFIQCCTPEQGALLQVLARGRAGGIIGETGTGCGAGLAWMASAVGLETRLVSVEIDATRAAACQSLFAGLPNVTVLHGDWRLIEKYGPFDLLVLDGGGGGKREDDPPADPTCLLKPGGTLVLDDFHPPFEFWPEEAAPRDEYGRSTTAARQHWLLHPELFATEVRVHPQVSAIMGTRKAPRS